MAFTLVLIPVALLGLGVGLLTIAYGILGLGYLVGQRSGIERADVAAAAGVVAVMALLQVFQFVPVVGTLAGGAILLAGLGAVVITCYGLAPFEPPTLPG